MKLNDYSNTSKSCDFQSVKQETNKSEEAKNIGNEIKSWFFVVLKSFKVDENILMKDKMREYFFSIKTVSEFTADYYKIPEFTANFIKKHMPNQLVERIKNKFGKGDSILMCIIFYFLNEVVNVGYLLGGYVWSFMLQKDAFINKEMKEIEKKKEEGYYNEDH